ncbi:hypothetical protein OF83DRAFT_325241 [Amylostereum chailletii]|nr:hypothetical protein OF83DRAFT_325241 [Amylostereum chailletii]
MGLYGYVNSLTLAVRIWTHPALLDHPWTLLLPRLSLVFAAVRQRADAQLCELPRYPVVPLQRNPMVDSYPLGGQLSSWSQMYHSVVTFPTSSFKDRRWHTSTPLLTRPALTGCFFRRVSCLLSPNDGQLNSDAQEKRTSFTTSFHSAYRPVARALPHGGVSSCSPTPTCIAPSQKRRRRRVLGCYFILCFSMRSVVAAQRMSLSQQHGIVVSRPICKPRIPILLSYPWEDRDAIGDAVPVVAHICGKLDRCWACSKTGPITSFNAYMSHCPCSTPDK